MQTTSVAAPALGAFSALVDARMLDPNRAIMALSKGLTPFDEFSLLVTLDSAATPSTSPNMVTLGTLRGAAGLVTNPVKLQGFPFFALQRTKGTLTAGLSVIASGPTNGSGLVVPTSIVLPILGVAAAISIFSKLKNPMRVGLSAEQTSSDTFDVYGTDDSTATTTDGSSFLGSIQGGGDLTRNSILVNDYLYALIVRTGGGTAGHALAYGPSDNTTDQPIVVPDQPGGGNITPTVGTAQQLVDENFTIEVNQTTGGQVLTFPNPTLALATQRRVINVGAVNFTIYGKVLTPVATPQTAAAIVQWVPGSLAWVIAS